MDGGRDPEGGPLMPPDAPLGYYFGDDAYSVARGSDGLAARLAAKSGATEQWRLHGAATNADEIVERVATAPLFGGGTLVVVSEPGPLVASKQLAARLAETVRSVAPGNGLAFLEMYEGSDKNRPAALQALQATVADAGGEVKQFAAPRQQEMARWIEERASERGITIAPAGARLLAERVGAFVREGDVDRRRQGELAVAELEKLAVYRDGQQIRPDDVAALVADAVPGSVWAFLDAVAMRRAGEAAVLAQKLGAVPGPVLLVHLHRRMRELLVVAEMVADGEDPASIIRTTKLNPYVARKHTEHVRVWTLPELEAALDGLLELDSSMKRGGDGLARAGVELWLAERVARSRVTARR